MSNEKPAHGTFCWNELMTRNTDGAEKFYTQLLGWSTAESGFAGVKYTLWKVGDKDGGGMMAMPPEVPAEVPAHWLSYISVNDVDALVGKVTDLGGQILVPVTDIPHVGRF